MKTSLSKTNSGFTLVETLVAITILIIGVLGPLSLAARGISDGLFAQNQLTASLLAQEAMETIINRRNTNILENPEDPFRGIISDYYNLGSTNMGIDGPSGTIIPNAADLTGCADHDSSGHAGCYLKYDLDLHHYVQSTDGTGQFFRQIKITEPGPPFVPSLDDGQSGEYRVDVTITWFNKNVRKSFSLSEFIYAK